MTTPPAEKPEVTTNLEQIIQAWETSKEGKYALESVKVSETVLQSIASGKPISVEEFAVQIGRTLKESKVLFRGMRLSGADFDDEGRLVGNALTMRPTQYLIRVDDQILYAWCALDTLFIPGLIGKTAEIRSSSPATGQLINLTVSPSGVEDVDPAEAVVSVVIPGVSNACEPGQPGGAQGAVCSSMHFFASHKEAEDYLGKETDVSILAVAEASELAQRAWVRPYRSALDSANRLEAGP